MASVVLRVMARAAPRPREVTNPEPAIRAESSRTARSRASFDDQPKGRRRRVSRSSTTHNKRSIQIGDRSCRTAAEFLHARSCTLGRMSKRWANRFCARLVSGLEHDASLRVAL